MDSIHHPELLYLLDYFCTIMVSADRSRRVKRDSASNLYRQCQVTGNCPPDVVNKVEGNTLADRILKVISSIVYLGGLGIGTGRGSGGTTGYGPINSAGGRVTGTGTVMRPGVTVEPIGPGDIVTVDSVGPGDSSLIPLLEVTPDVPINGGPEVPSSGPDISTVDVTSSIDPISDLSVTGTTISNTDSAVIDVQPSPGPRRVIITRSDFNNPSYVSVVHPTQGLGESGGVISGESGGIISSIHELDNTTVIGARPPPERILDEVPGPFEDIELDTFVESSGLSEFDIEQPLTSTPEGPLQRAATRFRDLYNRRVQQVRVSNPEAFLTGPRQAVVFENPAFEPGSLDFELPASPPVAAPDPEYTDVVHLGRQRFSEVNRVIRVSRLGQRASMKTRSGLIIGGKVHFYTDLSPVATDIEMHTLGEISGTEELIDGLGSSSVIEFPRGVESVELPDGSDSVNELLDTDSADFSSSRLELLIGNGTSRFVMPDLVETLGPDMFFPSIDSGTVIHHPQDNYVPIILPAADLFPASTVISVDDDFADFYLHPSLRKRKRKYRIY